MAQPPSIAQQFIYAPKHGKGHGQNAKGSDLSAEMTELDLKPDTIVTVIAVDSENADRVHAEWVDDKGLDRVTSFALAEFESDFKKTA
jgi:ssRNA-specific RNase YbeY (16S rRNA maturation enzyme)